MTREEIVALVRETVEEMVVDRLSLHEKSDSVYTGGLDDSGQLYRDQVTIRLMWDNEVLGEASI